MSSIKIQVSARVSLTIPRDRYYSSVIPNELGMSAGMNENSKQCIQDYFNIINMYTLGFRNITINDKTSTGVMVVCLGPHQIN